MSPVHGQGAPTASRPRWSRPLAARVPDAPWGAEWQDALLCIAGTPRTWHPNLTGTLVDWTLQSPARAAPSLEDSCRHTHISPARPALRSHTHLCHFSSFCPSRRPSRRSLHFCSSQKDAFALGLTPCESTTPATVPLVLTGNIPAIARLPNRAIHTAITAPTPVLLLQVSNLSRLSAMAYSQQMDFHRPSSTLSVDRKPSTFSFDDNVTLDSNILDTPSIMSPTNSTQGMFSPDTSLWEDFPTGPFADRTSTNNNTNPFFEQNNNPFTRLPATQAATYGQQPSAWPLSDSSGSRTPTATKPLHAFGQGDFDSGPPSSFIPVGSHLASAFGGLPLHNNVRPSSVFPSAQSEQPLSPHNNTEWMALTAQELESRPGPKRMRPNTPPRSFSPRRDGIRKKNARFDIPPERSLLNIDVLIQNSTNDDEIKELKQQKRLLRNRQAAYVPFLGLWFFGLWSIVPVRFSIVNLLILT
jgi:hypothetical protein